MRRMKRPVSSAVVAQRCCDLLLSFPSAAVGGIQWRTLTRKYEERYATRFEISALGHTSPLAAATALLWDVLRLVDAEDTDNPVVAVEDAVVMVPQPRSLATWPSLYHSLCLTVRNHGTPEHAEADFTDGAVPGDSPVVAHGLLLSQLKQFLQQHWHANFDESGLGYFSDEGTFVRLKKMKHLVQAVLRWRKQRVVWKALESQKLTAVDEALAPLLELVASKKHNDLVLRLVHVDAVAAQQFQQSKTIPFVPSDFEHELTTVHADRAEVQMSSEHFEQHAELANTSVEPMVPWFSWGIFDDPFEPPPEIQSQSSYWMPFKSPAGSTTVPSDLGFCSGSVTPVSVMRASNFELQSGLATPASMSFASSFETQSGAATPVPDGFPRGNYTSETTTPGKICALVPVWLSGQISLMPSSLLGDRGVIPTGIVQQARALFEPAVASDPTHFSPSNS